MTKRKSHKIGTLDDAQKTAIGALALVARIRAAVGDPEGRLMQDELIEHCRQMRDLLTRADNALENYGLGSEGSPLRSSIRRVLTLRGSSTKVSQGHGRTEPRSNP